MRPFLLDFQTLWSFAYSISRHASGELVRYTRLNLKRLLRKSFKRLKVTRPSKAKIGQ